jgi:bacterioferritin (cytochrome b1)
MSKNNNVVKHMRNVYDQATIDLLNRIHNSDEGHINWADIQHALIDQMGMENYLVCQTGSQPAR